MSKVNWVPIHRKGPAPRYSGLAIMFLLLVFACGLTTMCTCATFNLINRARQRLNNVAVTPIVHGATSQQISKLDVVEFSAATAEHGCTCSVCLCDFEEQEKVKRLPCGHDFHQECIDKWLTKNAICPTCRASILSAPSRRRSASSSSQGATAPTHDTPSTEAESPVTESQPQHENE